MSVVLSHCLKFMTLQTTHMIADCPQITNTLQLAKIHNFSNQKQAKSTLQLRINLSSLVFLKPIDFCSA